MKVKAALPAFLAFLMLGLFALKASASIRVTHSNSTVMHPIVVNDGPFFPPDPYPPDPGEGCGSLFDCTTDPDE